MGTGFLCKSTIESELIKILEFIFSIISIESGFITRNNDIYVRRKKCFLLLKSYP